MISMRPAGAHELGDAVTQIARQEDVAVAPVGIPVDARPHAVCPSISRKVSSRLTDAGSRRSRYIRTRCIRSEQAAWRSVE